MKLAALFLTILAFSAPAHAADTTLYDLALKSTALVRAPFEGKTSQGSAVVVQRHGRGNQMVLLTNLHVVAADTDQGYLPFVKVTFPEYREGRRGREVITDRDHPGYALGEAFSASVVHVDFRSDLALLVIDEAAESYRLRAKKIPADIKPMLFTPDRIVPGEEVFSIGSPAASGGYWAMTSGTIANVYSKPQTFVTDSGYSYRVKTVETQNPINPGDSGSALFDKHGRLVGINKSYSPTRVFQEDTYIRVEENRLKSQAIHLETVEDVVADAAQVFLVDYDTWTGAFGDQPNGFTTLQRVKRAEALEQRFSLGSAAYEWDRVKETEGLPDNWVRHAATKHAELFAQIRRQAYEKKISIWNQTAHQVTVRLYRRGDIPLLIVVEPGEAQYISDQEGPLYFEKCELEAKSAGQEWELDFDASDYSLDRQTVRWHLAPKK